MSKLTNSIIISIIILFFFNSRMLFDTTYDSLKRFFEIIVPSLFVMMVIIRFAYKQQIFSCLSIPFFARILNINQQAFQLLFSCVFLGFPSSAILIDEAFTNNLISSASARRLLYTCFIASPSFIIVTCGTVLFDSLLIGLLLFITQLFSCFFLLLISRNTPIIYCSIYSMPQQNPMQSLRKSILESASSLLMIGGYLLLFSACSEIILQHIPSDFAQILKIILEFSSGSIIIAHANLPLLYLYIGITTLLSFGGFCVHLQIFALVENLRLNYLHFLIARMGQIVLSTFIFVTLYEIIT